MGCNWPPQGISPLDAFSVPLLNTAVLLSSGATVTWAHHSLVAGRRGAALGSLLITCILGILFTCLQLFEYIGATFTMADGAYGSIFYLATGFHGSHVGVGTFLLFLSLIRLHNWHFTRDHHLGFVTAAWYWHFVDVVWLFLFVCIYWWGS